MFEFFFCLIIEQVQQLLDQILTCKKNAEAEVRREDGDGLKASKRKMDQKTAERTLKYFKASLETGRADRIPGQLNLQFLFMNLTAFSSAAHKLVSL